MEVRKMTLEILKRKLLVFFPHIIPILFRDCQSITCMFKVIQEFGDTEPGAGKGIEKGWEAERERDREIESVTGR